MFKTLMQGLQSSDWGKALDFLSPDFFKVVPTIGMSRLLTRLSANFVNASLAAKTRRLWVPILAELADGFRFGLGSDQPNIKLEQRGQLILQLYFATIMSPEPGFIDLRSNAFSSDQDGLLWNPQPWVFSFSNDFREAMQHIYQGFYEENPALFTAGLRALQLEHSQEIFLAIFGRVKQDSMHFRLQDFRDSFHQIFLSCRQHGTALHPEFLPLGLLLYSLYEHAEKLDVPLLPAQAWQDARKKFASSQKGVSS